MFCGRQLSVHEHFDQGNISDDPAWHFLRHQWDLSWLVVSFSLLFTEVFVVQAETLLSVGQQCFSSCRRSMLGWDYGTGLLESPSSVGHAFSTGGLFLHAAASKLVWHFRWRFFSGLVPLSRLDGLVFIIGLFNLVFIIF